MKLFTRYTRINLAATVIVFLLSGIAFYFLIRFIILDQVDEDLKIEQHEIQTYAEKYHHLPEIIQVRDQHTDYTRTDQPGLEHTFSSVPLKEHNGRETELYRQLLFYIEVQGQWYQVSVSKSLESTDHLIGSIISIVLITILVMLAISAMVNRLVLGKLWKPFYETLSVIQNFQLGKNKLPVFSVTGIEEFNIMNETLKVATSQAHQDYQYLKEFTENASHELQTPIAIIRSKMDVLIQDENLSEQQSKTVQGAYEAIERLSRLNQGLLLLTKIENGQFDQRSDINLSEKLQDKLRQFDEMIAGKKIKTAADFPGNVEINMNPSLLDILLNNLLGNAIKYNIENGMIQITAKKGMLVISNSSAAYALDKSRLFRRFAKSGQAAEGVGLGLAIVRQLAEVSGFNISYEYEKNLHHFMLSDNN